MKRGLVLLALVPIVYVASVVAYAPVVVWHRWVRPGETAMMAHRARQADAAGEGWELRHQWVDLAAIDDRLEQAVVAAEDSRFWEHNGFDTEQIADAWRGWRAGKRARGASTITQQTVKNLYLSPSRDVLRKLREAILTAWMEVVVPKQRILELYLNVVELGPGVFGAEAASRTYFGRGADRLGAERAALLAATLPAPLMRNPGRPTRGLARRQAMILGRLARWYGSGPAPPAEAAPAPGPEVRASEALELPAEPAAAEAGP